MTRVETMFLADLAIVLSLLSIAVLCFLPSVADWLADSISEVEPPLQGDPGEPYELATVLHREFNREAASQP